jgi:hypothetical protein
MGTLKLEPINSTRLPSRQASNVAHSPGKHSNLEDSHLIGGFQDDLSCLDTHAAGIFSIFPTVQPVILQAEED